MKKRLFIGIPLAKEILEKIKKIEKSIDKRLPWIPIENLHLTLIFIGWVDEDFIKKISEVLDLVKFELFSIKIKKIDYALNNQMIWLYFKERKVLNDLHKMFSEFLEKEKIPFEREKRKFLPHINLIRLKDVRYGKQNVRKLLNWEFQADKINLYESKLQKPFAKYEILKTKRL